MVKNKRKNILKITKIEEVKSNIPTFLRSNYIIYTILVAIIGLSFYIRGILPWNATFANGVTGFATDDSVYHMRLVENLIANFPNRLTFDAFTQYPNGSLLSWGSFYDLIIGSLALIFGVNNLNVIGALIPAIMGALVVIPVYFIGKELLNKKSGLISAFIIAILPGAFLQRSTLGFTDHHVAEVLFSTFFIMFFMIAINRATNISVKEFVSNPLFYIRKTSLKYALLSGIFLGFYILTWTTGLIFAGIIAAYIILQIIINYYTNKSNTTLLLITYISYVVAALMVLPYVDLRNGFGVTYYSPTHIISLLSVPLICSCLCYMSIKCNEKKYNIFKFLGVCIALLIFVVIIVKLLFPLLFINTFGSLDIVFGAKSGGGLTIAEAAPTNFGMVSSMFGVNFTYSIIAILILIYYMIVEKKEKVLIILIWSILFLLMLFAQNRFAYYFAVNIAILSGFMFGYALDHIGKWKDIKNINAWNISTFIFVILIVGFYPTDNYTIASQTASQGVKNGGFYEWNSAMTWMRNNTPDTGLDYYGTYERPEVGMYNYPEKAYGVMSWWDYGHVITYWAHRIPNANPFQAGIGGGATHSPGASTFLIAPTEDEANKVLDALGTNGKSGARYIVSDAYMAYSIQSVFAEWDGTNFDYYQQIRTSQGMQIIPTNKYYNTMESKLHIFDTNGLKHYRLVHESLPNVNTAGGSAEQGYKNIYNVLINKNNPIPIEVSGYVKIFEYVPGANIEGVTNPNSEVKITLNILTNINRTILYTQKTTSDSEGHYNMILPYSTSGSIPEGTQFDTKPVGTYSLLIDNRINIGVGVSEQDVLEGRTIYI
jgi:dolichyl-diphosphooligosaccharide--protein glycosyltransferase